MVGERVGADASVATKLTTHQRDLAQLGRDLEPWLASRLGVDTVTVTDIHTPDGGGMSSVTVLLTAGLMGPEGPVSRDLVVRLPPDQASYPVFPSYDLRLQYDVMAAVGRATDVPVPGLVGVDDGDAIGTPFLVMDAVTGRAPTDNPPYVFGGWLADATPEERRAMSDATASILARIHSVPPTDVPGLVVTDDPLRTHVEAQREYYAWTHADDGVRIPLLERAFDWLEEHWPTDPGDAVLSWGDARPGNILWEGWTPVAVLDWEMASVAPRGVDVAWFPLIHRFFQDIAEVFELPGLPDFGDPDEFAAAYAAAGGEEIADLRWYLVYNALRHGIVMARIKRRMIHFGEETRPEDPDDYVMHRALLARLMGLDRLDRQGDA